MLCVSKFENLRCSLFSYSLSPLWILATLVIGVIIPAAARADCTDSAVAGADTEAPCFSANDDILGGQRFLLRTDDLILGIPFTQDGAKYLPATNVVAETVDIAVKQTKTLQAAASVPSGGVISPHPWPYQVRAGRVFNLPRDVLVTLSPGSNLADLNLLVDDAQQAANNSTQAYGFSSSFLGMLVTDFNGDGFDDVFSINAAAAVIHTAVAPDDPAAGLTLAADVSFPDSTSTPMAMPVSGDFNRDGVVDIAWAAAAPTAGSDLEIRFLSVCPAAGATVLGQTCSKAFEIVVSPSSIDTGDKLSLVGPYVQRLFPIPILAAGDFDGQVDPTTGRADAELVVALGKGGGQLLTAYTFDDTAQALTATAANTLSISGVQAEFALKSGQLDWSRRQEQLVHAGYSATTNNNDQPIGATHVSVITLDPATLAMTLHTVVRNYNPIPFVIDLAIGRFDPAQQSNGNTNFDQQIAVLYEFVGDTQFGDRVDLFTMNDSSFDPQFVDTWTVGQTPLFYGTSILFWTPLHAGDTQGRSLQLGSPEIARVAQMQPDTILGMPPMHLDYMGSASGTTPSALNVSAYPTAFNTGFTWSDTTKSSSSRTSTTSYTSSTKESTGTTVSYGVPDVASLSATFEEATMQTHENTVSSTYDSYATDSYSLSGGTSSQFGDQVAYTSYTMNVYTYPVLGQTVCPEGSQQTSNSGASCCPAADLSGTMCTQTTNLIDQLPQTVQFSGPDDVTHHLLQTAEGLEFYQPIYEVGNVLSYPGSQSQIESGVSALGSGTPLSLQSTSEPTLWSSQASVATSITWGSGSSQEGTTGSVQNHSFDTSVAVAGKAEFGSFGGEVNGTFAYSSSKSISSLNSSSSTSDASQGVTVNRTIPVNTEGQATNSAYQYNARTFVFGQTKPDGALQDLSPQQEIDYDGFTWVAFAATPYQQPGTQTGTSSWWRVNYDAAPDLALNHPTRWTVYVDSTSATVEHLFNCPLGFTSSFSAPECAPISPPSQPTLSGCNYSNPNNAANACAFYNMKGFFITPGDGATDGPQISAATAGDALTLRARVANYSLQNLAEGVTVYTQFYAQQTDAFGDFMDNEAVFIGTATLQGTQLPGVCGGLGQGDPCAATDPPRNWDFAQVTWDTSTLPAATQQTNSYWYFWVVTWAVDANGIVAEMPNHGVTFTAAQVDPSQRNWDSFIDVPTETYGNNVGFYGQWFTLDADPAAAVQGEPDGPVQLDDVLVDVFPQPVLRKRLVSVSGRVRAWGGSLRDVLVTFSEGDAAAPDKLFDMNWLPRIEKDQLVTTGARYQPATCGPQTVVVQVIPHDGITRATTGSREILVTTDPVDDTRLMLQSLDELDLGKPVDPQLRPHLQRALQKFERGQERAGIRALEQFTDVVQRLSEPKLRGNKPHSSFNSIPEDIASTLEYEAQSIIDCMGE